MSETKCPFCQHEYIITKDDSCFGQQRCVCRNPNCEFDGWHFPVKLVSELIRTRKALEIIKKEMSKETMPDFAVIHNALKTALEQGGDNE